MNIFIVICEFTKHKRVPFPISNKRSSILFYLVHNDIWGPSTIANVMCLALLGLSRLSMIALSILDFLLKFKLDASSVFPNYFLNFILIQIISHL